MTAFSVHTILSLPSLSISLSLIYLNLSIALPPNSPNLNLTSCQPGKLPIAIFPSWQYRPSKAKFHVLPLCDAKLLSMGVVQLNPFCNYSAWTDLVLSRWMGFSHSLENISNRWMMSRTPISRAVLPSNMNWPRVHRIQCMCWLWNSDEFAIP